MEYISKPKTKGLLTLNRVARDAGESQSSMRKWVAAGHLPEPTHRLDARTYYTAEEADQCVRKIKAFRRWQKRNPFA